MPPRRPQQASAFTGGINRSLNAKRIGDNELVEALNLVYDTSRGLRSRQGVGKLGATNPFPSKVDGIHYYNSKNGAATVLYVSGGRVWRAAPADVGSATFTEVTNSLSLPSGTKWHSTTFDDVLLLATGADTASGDESIVEMATVSSNLAATTATSGTIPKALDIETFARRVFVIDADDPGSIRYCGLGDRQNWDTTDASSGAGLIPVGEDDGGNLVRIKRWRDRLIIFKRDSIYQLIPGALNTDAQQFEVRLITDEFGCVGPWTVQEILGDLVFLSEAGLASLSLILETQRDDLGASLVSRKVPELSKVIRSVDTFDSTVDSENMRYYLTVPSGDHGTENDVTWVLDYSGSTEGFPLAWTQFDGGFAGRSLETVRYNGDVVVHVGGYHGAYREDFTSFADDVETNERALTRRVIRTKAYDFGSPLERKDVRQISALVETLTDPVDFNLSYRLDLSTTTYTRTGSFSTLSSGSELDGMDVLDTTFKLATGTSQDTDIKWVLRGTNARRGQNAQVIFESTGVDQGFVFYDLAFKWILLTDRRVNDFAVSG